MVIKHSYQLYYLITKPNNIGKPHRLRQNSQQSKYRHVVQSQHTQLLCLQTRRLTKTNQKAHKPEDSQITSYLQRNNFNSIRIYLFTCLLYFFIFVLYSHIYINCNYLKIFYFSIDIMQDYGHFFQVQFK
jgi:hypothetical protein